MFTVYNKFECYLVINGEKKTLKAMISNTLIDETQEWCTGVKITPFFNDWKKIYGDNSWQSMTLAIGFISTFLRNYSEQLYDKECFEKIPFDAIFLQFNAPSGTN